MSRRGKSNRHTCMGKRRFRDHDEAIRSLHRVTTKSPRVKQPKRAYFCEDCRGYHLTAMDIDKYNERSRTA